MTNCFTFSPLGGFLDGISIATNVAKIGGGVHPQHVAIGDKYVVIDKVRVPNIQAGLLMEASVREVHPASGKNSFNAISKKGDDTIVVFVDINLVPAGAKRKLDPSVINAWVHFESNATLVAYNLAFGKALVSFGRDGESTLIFDRDGAVYSIARQDGMMVVQPLSVVEQAKERTRLLKNQVRNFEHAVAEGKKEFPVKEVPITRLHGILGGAVRLLSFLVRYDREACTPLVDFLVDHVGAGLSEGVRKETYNLLRTHGHPQAIMFAEGFDTSNVVSFKQHADGASARAKAEQKRKERSARDADDRAKMKGKSGGGGDNKKANKQAKRK